MLEDRGLVLFRLGVGLAEYGDSKGVWDLVWGGRRDGFIGAELIDRYCVTGGS